MGNCKISVVFSPVNVGVREAALIVSSAGQKAAELRLTGTSNEIESSVMFISGIPEPLPTPPNSSQLSINTTLLTYDQIEPGKTGQAQIVLKNRGASPIVIGDLKLIGANADEFKIANKCTRRIPAKKVCAINVEFSPRQAGGREAALMIVSNTNSGPVYVALKGTSVIAVQTATIAAAPRIEASPSRIDFGLAVNRSAATQEIVSIRNTGSVALTINSISLADNAAFTFNDINCRGRNINPKDSCSISIGMRPRADGDFKTSLIVQSNAQNDPLNIPLEALVQLMIKKAPSLVIFTNGLHLSFTGRPAADRKFTRGVVRLSNQGESPLTVNDVGIDGPYAENFNLTHKCKGAQLPPDGHCDIEVLFTP